jgi:multidrug resistance efflux pump
MFQRLLPLSFGGMIFLGIGALLLVQWGGLSAQDKKQKTPDPSSKESAPKLPTHKIKREPFKIDVSLKGVFESKDMTEVVLRPQAWGVEGRGLLTVLKAAEQGTSVHKGDVLVTLDLEKIDQAIRELENDRRFAELAIHQAEAELPILERAAPLDVAIAERQKKIADEDLKRYSDVDRSFSEKLAQFFVKFSKNSLEYAEEELKQLEKMYRAKDLREETEEMIVKRQRNEVEMANFRVQSSEIRRDQALKVELPRQEQHLKDNAEKQGLLLERTKITTPLTLNQKRLALEKMKYDYDKVVDRLKKLRRDHDIMTVKSPADGIVYYGKCTHGHWSSASAMSSKLQRGGVLSPEEVFMTIVQPRPMFVRATVEEKELRDLTVGQAGKIVPTSFPDLKPPGKIESISPIPVSSGNFEAKIAVEEADAPKALVPGMACTAKFVALAKEDALVAPTASIFTGELDEDQHYVYLVGADGKPAKRTLKIGRASGGKTEILEGLKEGDQILQSKPEAK